MATMTTSLPCVFSCHSIHSSEVPTSRSVYGTLGLHHSFPRASLASVLKSKSSRIHPSKGRISASLSTLSQSRLLWLAGERRMNKLSVTLPDNGSRWSAGQWLENVAQVEAEVPLSVAWDIWMDREGIPQFMPWISSVVVQPDKPELSKWTLKYAAFGRDLEFSWMAKNLTPTFHQKIHWKAVDGVPNWGKVRFYPRGPNACGIQLTISYEVPQALAPFASALTPLVETIIKQDLQRFATLAKAKSQKAKAPL
eukprot:TRINITY_DN6545_c1_g4_i1.p1 TRINITY_DN6545_c1_g4~~TRINITY_DN6545_c1_g4_i1.p1  ORF type:complete len:253 (-),score=23.75 TRINITY_DN6545_c1_g4_i1:231-989(-)